MARVMSSSLKEILPSVEEERKRGYKCSIEGCEEESCGDYFRPLPNITPLAGFPLCKEHSEQVKKGNTIEVVTDTSR